MKIFRQSFLKIKADEKVHIGTNVLGNADVVCEKRSGVLKCLGNEYNGKDICEKCRELYLTGKRAFIANPLAGDGHRNWSSKIGRI